MRLQYTAEYSRSRVLSSASWSTSMRLPLLVVVSRSALGRLCDRLLFALDAQGGATDLGERAVPAGAGPVRVRPWSIRFVELPDARAPQCF